MCHVSTSRSGNRREDAELYAGSIVESGRVADVTFRFGLDAGLNTFDLACSGSSIERAISASLCDHLLNTDASLNVAPELATV